MDILYPEIGGQLGCLGRPNEPILHCTVNIMDNLNIRGIQDDTPRRCGKTRGKARKPFAIEARLALKPHTPKKSVFWQLGLKKWWVWGRYKTASRRDQAYAALVKREERDRHKYWGHWEYRKAE